MSPRKRPTPVLIAIVLSATYIALSVAPLTDDVTVLRAVPLIVSGLITAGLWRGNRLARQWTMLVGGITGALTGVYAMFTLSGPWQLTLLTSLLAVVPIAIVVLLSLRTSKHHFGLICPFCRSTKTLPGNFLYTRQRCRKCKRLF